MMVTESQEEGKSMKKSVYSLVLSDDVVEAVDRAAYQNGLSRSAMVNQILADYVSYTTPEKRMREIFSQVESLLTGGNAAKQPGGRPAAGLFSFSVHK